MATATFTITSHNFTGDNEGSDLVTITATGNLGNYVTNGAVINIALINAALATAGVDRDISYIHYCQVQAEAQTNRYTWVKSSTTAGLAYGEVVATDTELASAADISTDLVNYFVVCGK